MTSSKINKTKLSTTIATILVLAIIVLANASVIELYVIEGYFFYGAIFSLLFGVLGLIIGIISEIMLRGIFMEAFEDTLEAINIGLITFCFIFIVPAIASFCNRKFPQSVAECSPHVVVDKKYSVSTEGGEFYYLYFDVEGTKENFSLNKQFWLKTNEGEEVSLYIAEDETIRRDRERSVI